MTRVFAGRQIRYGQSHASTPQKKKDQLSLAQYGDKLFLRTGPIPTTPGGWGLRNPEPKGPGQLAILYSQSSRAAAGRKVGSIMISANDPVTDCPLAGSRSGGQSVTRGKGGGLAPGPFRGAAGWGRVAV